MINVVLFGYGHLGRWHAQKVDACDSAKLVAIVEPFDANKSKAKEAHPDAQVVSDFKEINGKVDAAVIVTPTSFHFDVAKQMLNENLHVFCEKPLVSNYEQAKELESLQADKVFQVGHSERCHIIWDKIKPLLGKRNDPFIAKLTRAAAFKGRATDVDVVQDLMIHDLDLILFLSNKKPISVEAYGKKVVSDKWDHVTCKIKFEDSSVAEIVSSRTHVKEIRDFEILTDAGMLYVDLFKNEFTESFAKAQTNGEYTFLESYEKRDHLLIEHKAFYDSILNNKAAMVTLKEGADIVNLLDKVAESLQTGQAVKL